MHCQRIITKAAEDGEAVILSYFFGRTGGRQAACARYFAVSLLVQLFDHEEVNTHPAFASILPKFHRSLNLYQDVHDCQVEGLLDLLTNILNLASKFLIVVDALDECIEDLPVLQEYLHKVGCQSGSKVIVSALDKFFWHGNQNTYSHLRLDRSIVEPDITLFLEYRSEGNAKFGEKRADIIETILERSQGIFLLSRLLIDDLETAESVNEQLEKMAHFGDLLSDEYQRQFDENDARLKDHQRIRRDNILLLLLAARKSLSVEAVCETLALNESTGEIDEKDFVFEPAKNITSLCRPLVEVDDTKHVMFTHASVTQFLQGKRHLKKMESDIFLARKCLAALRQRQYRNWPTPARLLRKHLLEGTLFWTDTMEVIIPKYSATYNYATEHFQDHVTGLTHPPEDIIENLAAFLLGIEFVSYSEYLLDLTNQSSLSHQIKVYNTLLNWTKQLPAPIKAQIPITDYFEVAHVALSDTLRDESRDNVLLYLPLIRNGNYFNSGGQSAADWQRAYKYKEMVVAGLTENLGKDNPVTLRYLTSLLQEYFWQKRFEEVLPQLIDVARAQRLLGEAGEADLYTTLWLLGLAYHCLTRLEEALTIFTEAAEGFKRRVGEYDRRYLLVGLFKGHTLEALQQLAEAKSLYEDVKNTLTPILGAANGFTLMSQTAIGAIQRKQGHFEAAKESLLAGWGGRESLFGIDVNVCLDAAVQLALAYRDHGEGKLCLELLDTVAGSVVYAEDFERRCQTVHIRALVAFDKQDHETGVRDLLALLHEAGLNRERNNRELMWVRESLALVLRHLRRDDDALMLFAGLVALRDEEGWGLADEPEPPSQLRVAEEAIHFVRLARAADARELLHENGLHWVREADFYILGEGGPVADTAVIAPIKFPARVVEG